MSSPTFLESVSLRAAAIPTEELGLVLERLALELATRGNNEAAIYCARAVSCILPDVGHRVARLLFDSTA